MCGFYACGLCNLQHLPRSARRGYAPLGAFKPVSAAMSLILSPSSLPGGAHALSPAADAITFMMLMNSSIRRFLVGEQIRGAPYLEKFDVEALPTGYLVCAPGGRVGEVGQAELIQEGQTDEVYSYALTARMFGFKILYLEAGSGAETQVHPRLIETARTVDNLTLLVGGGIRTPEQAVLAANAGADWIVTGTLTEDAADLDELRSRISGIVSALRN